MIKAAKRIRSIGQTDRIPRKFTQDDVDCVNQQITRTEREIIRAKGRLKAKKELLGAVLSAKSDPTGPFAKVLAERPELLVDHDIHLAEMIKNGELDRIKRLRERENRGGFFSSRFQQKTRNSSQEH
jgi:hypothetical protein